jgi:ribonuclease J
MTHSIPDTTHIFIQTPAGNVYHGSDFKFDLTPVYGLPPDFNEINRAAELGVKILLSDALGAEREGVYLIGADCGQYF